MNIGKTCLLFFLSLLIGAAMVPEFLASSDSDLTNDSSNTSSELSDVSKENKSSAGVLASDKTDLSNASDTVSNNVPSTSVTAVAEQVATTPTDSADTAVITAPVSVPTTTPEVTQTPVVAAPASTSTPAPVSAPAPVSVPAPVVVPVDSISIAGRTINIVDVNSTTVASGDHVNFYRNKFLYGHNSSAIFGGLKNLSIGATFTITHDGVTSTYRIVNRVVYQYEETGNGALRLNGDGRNYFLNTVRAKDNNDVQYAVSLMTCHGVSYGGDNATERLVLFANKI